MEKTQMEKKESTGLVISKFGNTMSNGRQASTNHIYYNNSAYSIIY